ncbi:MAG: aconitase X, partial [Candidatus Micrarchaeota archaeon]|nr:aconitase X [Candidatus Micrarchaeota archaeon]
MEAGGCEEIPLRDAVRLSKKQQSMLDGECGEAVQQAMEILVALGKIYGAQGMVSV